jgi:hypothetical protein
MVSESEESFWKSIRLLLPSLPEGSWGFPPKRLLDGMMHQFTVTWRIARAQTFVGADPCARPFLMPNPLINRDMGGHTGPPLHCHVFH